MCGFLAAGAAVGAVSSIAGGFAKRNALRKSARQREREALEIIEFAALQEGAVRRRNRRQAGQLLADMAKAGVSASGTASGLDLVFENAREQELEALNVRYDGFQRAGQAFSEARNLRRQGSAAVFGGFKSATLSVLSAGGKGAFG